jgi:hypothetical protein
MGYGIKKVIPTILRAARFTQVLVGTRLYLKGNVPLFEKRGGTHENKGFYEHQRGSR